MTTDPPEDFRQRLVTSQTMSADLRNAYRDELDKLVNEKHTARSRVGAIIFLVICIAVVIGEIWAMLHYPHAATLYIGGTTMLLVCAAAAVWIVRDLLRGQSERRKSLKFAEMFYTAAAILTVASLMHGLAKSSDPASTFNAFYVYIFLFVCAMWGLSTRMTAATIEMREHLLRVESRLADLAERLPK